MSLMPLTELVFHAEMSALKDVASLNMLVMLVTWLTSQEFMSHH